MAKVGAVFQNNVFQDNAFQDNTWGGYVFQRNVFQGKFKRLTFQANIFQDNIFAQETELPAVFDRDPVIIKILNESISISEAVVKLGGLLIVVQWPVNIYKQVLMAMQKQVAANSIYIFFRSLRGILSVLS